MKQNVPNIDMKLGMNTGVPFEWRTLYQPPILFHYASEEGELSIKRPTSEETFNPIEGIKSSYQFFALRQGEVLARLRSCWCVACVSVAMCGPGSNKLSSQYQVSGCPHSANDDEHARFLSGVTGVAGP